MEKESDFYFTGDERFLWGIPKTSGNPTKASGNPTKASANPTKASGNPTKASGNPKASRRSPWSEAFENIYQRMEMLLLSYNNMQPLNGPKLSKLSDPSGRG